MPRCAKSPGLTGIFDEFLIYNVNRVERYRQTTFQAIRDGVIEATLNHDKGWMQSKENTDIYCTREPQLAFHERIEFCLDLHNSSVKAMRFPPKSYNQGCIFERSR